MKDRFTEAMEELQRKSPFVCASCSDVHEIAMERENMAEHGEGVKDRFTEAMEEQEERSAFVCESCRH